MLAEIFFLKLESIVRANGTTNQGTTSSDTRFVPIAPKPSTKQTDRRT